MIRIPKTWLSLIFIGLISLSGWAEQATKPLNKETLMESYHPYIARIVAGYLSYNHYSGMRIDDFSSREMFENYFESLDYGKMYFLSSDIDRFRPFQYALDDMLLSREPDLRLAFDVYELFQKRVKERVEANLALLDHKFDFSVDESYQPDRQDAEWAESKKELDELWRKRVKDQVLGFLLRDKPYDETIELLKKRYRRNLKDVTDVEGVEILEAYLSSLTKVFDPHSSYLRPATKENFNIGMEHSLEGIGATLRRDQEYTTIVDLTPGGPASLSGQLQPGDKIIAVAQGDEEAVDTIDMKLTRVVRMIRGKKGTEVRLTVIPADSMDQTQTKIVTIIRDKVAITANDASSEIKEVTGQDGHIYRFGVINVPGFYQDSEARYNGDTEYKSVTRDVKNLIDQLKKDNVDAIAIDLRLNSGGSLMEAISLSGLFIEEGPIVQIRDRNSRKRVFNDPDPEMAYSGPLVVLTSPLSASASEIFAGAIKDFGRGIIIGSESTHGKGTVQNMVGLQSILQQLVREDFQEDVSGALKFTIQQFYRINGSSTQNKGVPSDIVLPSPYDRYGMRESELPRALPWDEIEAAKYSEVAQLGDLIAELKERSQQRISKNPEFLYLKEDIKRWESYENENRISLNLEKRKKELDDLEALEKRRDMERKERVGQKPQPKSVQGDTNLELTDTNRTDIPDYILEEAMNILADYCDRTGIKIAATDVNQPKKTM